MAFGNNNYNGGVSQPSGATGTYQQQPQQVPPQAPMYQQPVQQQYPGYQGYQQPMNNMYQQSYQQNWYSQNVQLLQSLLRQAILETCNNQGYNWAVNDVYNSCMIAINNGQVAQDFNRFGFYNNPADQTNMMGYARQLAFASLRNIVASRQGMMNQQPYPGYNSGYQQQMNPGYMNQGMVPGRMGGFANYQMNQMNQMNRPSTMDSMASDITNMISMGNRGGGAYASQPTPNMGNRTMYSQPQVQRATAPQQPVQQKPVAPVIPQPEQPEGATRITEDPRIDWDAQPNTEILAEAYRDKYKIVKSGKAYYSHTGIPSDDLLADNADEECTVIIMSKVEPDDDTTIIADLEDSPELVKGNTIALVGADDTAKLDVSTSLVNGEFTTACNSIDKADFESTDSQIKFDIAKKLILNIDRSMNDKYKAAISKLVVGLFNDTAKVSLFDTSTNNGVCNIESLSDIEELMNADDAFLANGNIHCSLSNWRRAVLHCLEASIFSVFRPEGKYLDPNKLGDLKKIVADPSCTIRVSGKPAREVNLAELPEESLRELAKIAGKHFYVVVKRRLMVTNLQLKNLLKKPGRVKIFTDGTPGLSVIAKLVNKYPSDIRLMDEEYHHYKVAMTLSGQLGLSSMS